MESAKSPLRLRLILGKFQVKDLSKGVIGTKATIDLGRGVSMNMDIPVNADLRLGDWLTFYTECPYALPSEPPIE